MRWDAFVKLLQKEGYDGDGDNFSHVSAWLKANGHDDECVEGRDGTEYRLEDLFKSRNGKRLNVADAEAESSIEDEVERRFAERVLNESKTAKAPARKAHEADVRHVRDRIADDPLVGYGSLGDFLVDVKNAGLRDGGGISEKLHTYHRVSKGALSDFSQEAVGAEGGFAVPPVMLEGIMNHVLREDSVAARCDIYQMQRNSLAVAGDETTPWQTSGGIQANWEGESGTYDQSKNDLKLKELRLRKLTVLAPVTEELLEDASALERHVAAKAADKIDFKLGEAIFRGNGAGQPLGFLNSGSVVEVDGESSQVADTVVQRNIEKLWEGMYAPYRANAVWFIHHEVEKELMRLSFVGRDDTGAEASAGSTVATYLQPGQLGNSSPFGSLMGRPVIVTQHCAALGDTGDVVFASMPQYWLGMKAGGINTQTSIHLWFDQDVVAYKFRMRVDGQPWLDAPITPLRGSATQSAFVVLTGTNRTS